MWLWFGAALPSFYTFRNSLHFMLLHKIVKQISDEHFRVRFPYSSSQLYKKFIAPIDKMELMSIIASPVRTTAAPKLRIFWDIKMQQHQTPLHGTGKKLERERRERMSSRRFVWDEAWANQVDGKSGLHDLLSFLEMLSRLLCKLACTLLSPSSICLDRQKERCGHNVSDGQTLTDIRGGKQGRISSLNAIGIIVFLFLFAGSPERSHLATQRKKARLSLGGNPFTVWVVKKTRPSAIS